MAYIQMRSSKDSQTGADVTYWRVGWRENGRQTWSPPIRTGEGAVEFKGLVERLGPSAALAILLQRSGRDVTRGAPLLRDWFARHLELLGADATPGTIADYRRMAERTWLPRLGALPLDAITREAVTEWVAWQRKQPTARQPGGKLHTYSAKSIKNAHGLLSGTLASAIEHDRGIVKNVAKGVGLPEDDVGAEMEIFTDQEWRAFIAAMDPYYVPLTRFLLNIGCRIGEATAVKVKDVNLDLGTVRIQRSWKKGEHGVYLGSTKTKRGKRTVVLSPSIVADLRTLVAGKDQDEFVFVGRQGGRIQAQHLRNRQWARALKEAGITKRLTPHSLRHTSASQLLTAGVSPNIVQRRLGHESLDTTSKVYAHLLTDEQVGAARIMERGLLEIES